MIARNEERILARSLSAVQWADEIVVVDSGSSDRTPEIARAMGAQQSFHLDFRGIAEQKNVAIARCTCDWVLLIDADEVVTPELAASIQQALAAPAHDAYMLPRLNLFLDRWMRHGGQYPDWKLRLVRRSLAHVDETIGPHGTALAPPSTGRLSGDLQHFGYPAFHGYLAHMNSYSTDAVPHYLRTHPKATKTTLLLHAFLNPLHSFALNYVLRGGFLDGIEGLIFHLNHAAYVHWKYVKAWRVLSARETIDGPAS
jgi:glycosyltransferase involved in cell wall biosynthesis